MWSFINLSLYSFDQISAIRIGCGILQSDVIRVHEMAESSEILCPGETKTGTV